MLQTLFLVVCGLLGFWFICRCVTWLICWVVKRLCQVDLCIGKVGFFTLGQVSLNFHNGLSLEIERLWFSSSFINNEIRKPLAVCSGGLRIQLELSEGSWKRKQKASSGHAGLPSILSYLQFLSFVFDNTHVILLRGPLAGCLAQLTIQETGLDWTIDYSRPESCLDLLVKVSGATGRLLLEGASTPCVAEVTLSQSIYLRIETATSRIQVARVTVEKPCIWVTKGFLQLISRVQGQSRLKGESPGRIEGQSPGQGHTAIPKSSSSDTLDVSQRRSNHGISSDIAKFIPDEVYVQLEDTQLAVFKEPSHRKLGVHIQDVLLQCTKPLTEGATNEPAIRFTVKDVKAGSSQVNVASLTEMRSSVKIDDQSIQLNAKILSGFFGYHQEEFQYWSSIIPQTKKHNTQSPVVSSSQTGQSAAQGNWITQLIGQRTLMGTMDFEHANLSIATASCSGIKGGIDEAKFVISMKLDHRGEGADIRCEAEMMGLSCMLAEVRTRLDDITSKQHHWGTVLYVGILITKVRCLSDDITVDSMLDSVQLEWSSSFADVITHMISAVQRGCNRSELQDVPEPHSEDRSRSEEAQGHSQSHPSPASRTISRVNVQCSSINGFLCNEIKVGSMLRVDSLNLQHRAGESSLKADGSKVVYFQQEGKCYPVTRSHEIHTYDAHLKRIEVQHQRGQNKMSVSVQQEVYLVWRTALHMSVFSAITEAHQVTQKLKGAREDNVPCQSPSRPREPGPPVLSVALQLRANCMLAMQLSKQHRVSVSIPEMQVESKRGQTTVIVPQTSISCDEHEIFTFEGVVISSMHHSAQLQLDREGFRNLELPTNRAWAVTLERVAIVFPHEYNFASCFTAMKNINKWRKHVHGVPSRKTSPGSLPPDLLIKAQNVMVQLSDDPFEVKLADNYELLSDESVENQKRLAAMDKRIQDLRKKYGLLPASKIDELYASLSRKAAEVYIQRSRQLYVASPCRTKLFVWSLTNLEIAAFADSSLHGKDNVVKHMRMIDKDSPYPEEGLEFVTQWCRMVTVSAEQCMLNLRDFPMPLLEVADLNVWGKLVGAEQAAASRARLSVKVEVEEPWGDVTVERNMPPLKFYHDFQCDVSKFNMAYGPCWEPTIAQYNLTLLLVNHPPVDPSPPLAFWDKSRLLLHGRLTMSVAKMRWIYHVSLDPYNTTELMDWTWTDLVLDWTNAKWMLHGDLDIYARTASKYDDCKLLHLPNLRYCIKLNWVCRGDANDHHSVMPCAPDKVPEYSHQDHDSYRAFRSENLNMSMSLETKPGKDPKNLPRCLFYGSTLRWMDKIKMCFARVSRPIRRGQYFNVTTPRKPQFTRHFKDNDLAVNLHGFEVQYWVSFARQHGVQMSGGELRLSVGAHLDLVPVDDGLVHRPQANWSIRQFLVQLNTTTIWLVSSSTDGEEGISLRGPVNKNYFLSVEKLGYQRDDPTTPAPSSEGSPSSGQVEERVRHHVQIFELKGAWTPTNRKIAFSLHDGYSKAQTLKKNLSSDALKGFKVDSSQTPAKNRSMSMTSPTSLGSCPMATPSPMTRIQAGPAYSMLQKLVSEADSRFVAVHEEVSGGNVQVEQLHGIQACQQEDALHRNWHIELYNSQVMLRGKETAGYVIVSAGRASILSREHQPVWRDRQLRSKTTWVGSLECMQYYATVDSGPVGPSEDKILWLSKEHIESVEDVTDAAGLAGMPEMIGSGQSVGGVVSDTLTTEEGGSGVQLQRIISRCKCQFFYSHFGEADRQVYPEVPPPPAEDPEQVKQEKQETGVNSFTLFHHDLNICTNSLQYAMILDIVNNLLLYVEPRKKEANEKLQKMRFQLQLSSGEDQRKPILHQQNTLRQLLSNMRRLERELYMVHKALEDDIDNPDLLEQSHELEVRLYDLKTQTTSLSAELAIMVSCFKENRLQLKTRKAAKESTTESAVVRRNEVCFKHAEWRMTESDGQIGIADLVLRNFLYTKINRSNDSGSHQLELGWVKVTNLLPNTLYKDVLVPQDLGHGHSDRQMSLRILCKFKAPVGGIPVYEHFEVNVVPITIQLTFRFYNTVMAFFFPGRNIDTDDTQSEDGDSASDSSSIPPQTTPAMAPKARSRRTNIRQKVLRHTDDDDIDKMKERAAQNNMFLFIKIPEVPMRLSYKGSKEKNLKDLYDLSLLLPALEYHNETWTWLDFLLAVKKDSKRILIQQAIKQKLNVRSRTGVTEEQLKSEGRLEEDKVKMLLGPKLLSGGDKPHSKKSLFGKSNTK